MSIKDILLKGKPFYTPILFVVIACLFFGLGRLSGIEEQHSPLHITYPNASSTANALSATLPSLRSNFDASSTNQNSILSNPAQNQIKNTAPNEAEVADLSGTGEVIGVRTSKKYYYPWCGTIKRVKPENQIHIASIAIARAAGFVPGGNCKGLK